MLTKSQFASLVELRHSLHRKPELSGEERQTAKTIAAYLEQFNPEKIIRNLGGHGVAAIFSGEASGPTVLLRCELDGLPIAEKNTLPWTSLIPGKAHLCGHDGHMAILCGVAAFLSVSPLTNGRVILLFQPAEETGAGARAVVNDPEFDAIKPDYAFSLHNYPGLRIGDVALKEGPINCASRGISVNFDGKTSHASEPENGVSPLSAICEFSKRVEGLGVCHDVEGARDANYALITVVHALLGEPAFGVSPGHGEVRATLRTVSDKRMETLIKEVEALVSCIAVRYRLSYTIEYHDVFASSDNNSEATEIISKALQEEGIPVTGLDQPMAWSEDFGVYGNHARSAMFFPGSGTDQPQLHNPDYDFPDELIDTGSRIFCRIIRNILD